MWLVYEDMSDAVTLMQVGLCPSKLIALSQIRALLPYREKKDKIYVLLRGTRYTEKETIQYISSLYGATEVEVWCVGVAQIHADCSDIKVLELTPQQLVQHVAELIATEEPVSPTLYKEDEQIFESKEEDPIGIIWE